MRISDVVDVKAFPYVCPFTWTIRTRYGKFEILRGWLSDGASGVPDRDLEGFFSHDRLYAVPEIRGRRITKWQADRVSDRDRRTAINLIKQSAWRFGTTTTPFWNIHDDTRCERIKRHDELDATIGI